MTYPTPGHTVALGLLARAYPTAALTTAEREALATYGPLCDAQAAAARMAGPVSTGRRPPLRVKAAGRAGAVWTIEEVCNLARATPSRSVFSVLHPSAYAAALRNGWLDQLLPMGKRGRPRKA